MTTNIEKAAALLGLLGHPKRLEALLVLGEGALSAGELGERLGLEQSAMSHQLRLLREANLVVSERVGRRVVYAVADHHVTHIVRDAVAHVAE